MKRLQTRDTNHRQSRDKMTEGNHEPKNRFSKLIHAPYIEPILENLASTFARPSGLIGAGAFGLVINIAALAASRYYGYEFSFIPGIYAMVAGFIAGIALEFLISLFGHNREKR